MTEKRYASVNPDELKRGDKIRVKTNNGTVWIPAVVYGPDGVYLSVYLDGCARYSRIVKHDWYFERELDPLPTVPGIYMSAAEDDPNSHTIYLYNSTWMSDAGGEGWLNVGDVDCLPRDLVRFVPEWKVF